MVLEEYTFIEAFYMTMITVSTVGFREVHELSPNGMVFTSMLIIFSIGTFAYTISAITTYFVAGNTVTSSKPGNWNAPSTTSRNMSSSAATVVWARRLTPT